MALPFVSPPTIATTTALFVEFIMLSFFDHAAAAAQGPFHAFLFLQTPNGKRLWNLLAGWLWSLCCLHLIKLSKMTTLTGYILI